MGEDKNRSGVTEEYKPETPAEEEPLNPLPDEAVEGDSDAPAIIKKEDKQVF